MTPTGEETMVRVGVAEAAARLTELLERAVAGEEIEIHWGGAAPVRLTPATVAGLFGGEASDTDVEAA